MEESDHRLWLAILEKNNSNPNPHHSVAISKHLSVAISKFCTIHQDTIDANAFQKLTNESSLPVISMDCAIELMELEQTVLWHPSNLTTLSCLQTRCTSAIVAAASWQRSWTHKKMQECLAKLPPLVLSKILSGTIQTAKRILGKAGGNIYPNEIVVSGAGVEAVNWVYTRSDSCFHEAPCFIKDGLWDGERAPFTIYRLRDYNHSMWFVSIAGDYGPGSDDDVDFYCADDKRKETDLHLPPLGDWEVVEGEGKVGSEPSPTLEFCYYNDDH